MVELIADFAVILQGKCLVAQLTSAPEGSDANSFYADLTLQDPAKPLGRSEQVFDVSGPARITRIVADFAPTVF